MNTILIILFVLCVLGFSVSTVVSPTAQTWLRDYNPRIQNWNYVLLGFSILLANFIRLPLTGTLPFVIWVSNLAICLHFGAVICAVVLIIGIAYHVWKNEVCI